MKWLEALISFLDWLRQTPPPVIPPPVVQQPKESRAVILARQAENWIGRDPSTPDIAKDELGCADSVSAIIKSLYPDFKHTVSTITLFEQLKRDKRFKSVLEPSIGCVIISPRIGDQPGHCGILISHTKIASNDSRSGLWQQNYTVPTWVAYFRKKKGLRVFLFQPK